MSSNYMDEITKNWHFSEGPHIPDDCGRAKPTLDMSPQLGMTPYRRADGPQRASAAPIPVLVWFIDERLSL